MAGLVPAIFVSETLSNKEKPAAQPRVLLSLGLAPYECARMARRSRAMMLVILIAGFTAGPAVSL